MDNILDELYPFTINTAKFNQMEDKFKLSPVEWTVQYNVLYCSAFEISRLLYFMFTHILPVPAFDQSLVSTIMHSCDDEFTLRVLASIRMLCEHRRTRTPHGTQICDAERRMRQWISTINRA